MRRWASTSRPTRTTGSWGGSDETLTIRVRFRSFEEWWEPFTLGVGPAGAYVAGLDDTGRAALRAECARRLPAGGFEISARAWCAVGIVPAAGRDAAI